MKKILSAVLAGVLLICGAVSVAASDINDLEQRRAELEAQQAENQAKLEQQNAAVEEQQGEIERINSQLESVSTEIRSCHQTILDTENDISEKEDQIKKANDKIEANMDILRQRLKAIYIAGDVSSLEVILGAKDFSDFLDKLQLVQYVSNHDEDLIKKIQKQLDAISAEKAALEQEKAALEEQKQTLEVKQQELNTILEENKETLASLQNDRDETEMNLSLSADELEGLSAEIQEYYRRQQEAIDAQQNSGGDSDGSGGGSGYVDPGAPTQIDGSGGWVWPTPGCYTITSVFGESRSYEYHGGIDIAASMGTPIYAAGAGTVVSSNNSCPHVSAGGNWCSCGGGYGNYIWILHDNGYETIYGHMTCTAVSTGTHVAAGQLIGYVGSSGWSTGPHLHFELRINGTKRDPLLLY